MHSRNKLPIIVGGTNYYIESLLWKMLDTEDSFTTDGKRAGSQDWKAELEKLGGAELHKRLSEVDPDMAAMLHPSNTRKIARSLQVLEQTGVPHSRWLEQQRGAGGGDGLGGALRYPQSCVFWLHAEMEVLDRRLDLRVDDMLEAGLLDELRHFHQRYNLQKIQEQSQDYQHGIFQSIGFKEFHEYLTAPETLPDLQRTTLLDRGVEALKIATRRYARRQNQWVRNRFLKRPGDNVPAVFGLDVTDLSKWEESVLTPALQILASLQQGERPDVEPIRVEGAGPRNKRSSYSCELCEKVILGEQQWTAHLKSKKHHYHVKKKRRLDPPTDQLQGTPPPAAPALEGLVQGSLATPAPGFEEACGESESTGANALLTPETSLPVGAL